MSQQKTDADVDSSHIIHSRTPPTKGKGQQGQSEEHQPHAHTHQIQQLHQWVALRKHVRVHECQICAVLQCSVEMFCTSGGLLVCMMRANVDR